jgi:hypothetical protein
MSSDLTLVSPTSAFTIPLADLSEFGRLSEARRVEVRLILNLLTRVEALRAEGATLTQAIAQVAAWAKHQGKASAPTLLRKFYLYEKSRDWRALVNHYRGPSAQPPEFIQEVKRVAELNHRSQGEAFQQLRERWAAGDSIPGYGTWIEHYLSLYPDRPLPKVWPRGFFPTGWSVRNLRNYGPSKGSRTLVLRGLAASKKCYPSVGRDPSQLRPLELIVLDDFELDCLCLFAGDTEHKPQIGRVAGLLAIDVATRRRLHWGMGQRMERHDPQPDGTVKTVRTGISRLDVQLFLHGLFAKSGLPDYHITILCENASASISADLRLSIATLFDGRITVINTGLIDHKTLANGYTEKGGRPWEKGWIESTFNKTWNILGAMPGYKGSNQRLNGPADLAEKIRLTQILIGHGKGAENLPPDKIALLNTPFPSLAECERFFAWACDLCDQRTAHRYLGFDKVTEFLLEKDGEPQPFEALALLAPERQTQVTVVERMESSVERWERLARSVVFTPIPREVLAVFLLTPIPVTYRNASLTFTRNGKGHTYVDPTGEVLAGIQEGTEFLGYLDPQHPEQLHITQLNGARTGTLTRLGGKTGLADIRDPAAIAAASAITATLVKRDMAAIRERHAPANQQLTAALQHNAAIVEAHRAETKGLSVAQKFVAAGNHAAAAQATDKAHTRAVQAVARHLSPEDIAAMRGEVNAPLSTPPAADLGSAEDYK